MPLKLVVAKEGAKSSGQDLVLDQAVVHIGRDPTSDVPLDDKLVSRKHARIWREGQAYFLEDLDSTQGTLLNDKKVKPGDAQLLRNGDVLKLPGYVITFQTWASDAVPSGSPEGTAYFAKDVLRSALKSLDENAPVLRVLATGDRMELPPGVEVLLGRDPSCDLVIEAEKVSRKHAKIRRDWGGVSIFDLESTNGVRVNGKKIEKERRLKDRDEIEIGGVRILFLDPSEVRDMSVPIPVATEKGPAVGELRSDAGVLGPEGPSSEPGTRMLDRLEGSEPGIRPPSNDAPALAPPPPPGADDMTRPLQVDQKDVDDAARALELERMEKMATADVPRPDEDGQPTRAPRPPPRRRTETERAVQGMPPWMLGVFVGLGLAAVALIIALALG